jgi:hypothetical protein
MSYTATQTTTDATVEQPNISTIMVQDLQYDVCLGLLRRRRTHQLTLSPRVGQSRLRTLKGTRLMQLAKTLLCHLAL